MLTSAEITESERRKSVRELANISTNSYSDDDLDRKIENSDSLAVTFFQVRGITLSGTEVYFRDLIVVSNLLASSLILAGLENQRETSIEHRKMAMEIVEAHNQKADYQNLDVGVTSGISSGLGTFS